MDSTPDIFSGTHREEKLESKRRSSKRVRSQRVTKRILELFLTLFGVLAISPILFVLWLSIKLDSAGPAFYKHKRLGKKGKYFNVYKFRSMVQDSQKILQEHLETHPELLLEWQESQKLKNDPRITRLGKFIRKYSLDELPQLINVLKGDMSLVGPRPIVEAEIEKYQDDFGMYCSVKPGMTGYWQVSGRSDTSYEFRVAKDVYYVENWSLWLDFKIILKTFKVVFKADGAY